MTNKTTKTTTIAGRSVTLETGFFYLASRPFASRRREVYPISISAMSRDGFRLLEEPSVVLDGLTYEQANEFLEAFNDRADNDGPTLPRYWGAEVEDDDRQVGDFVETEFH
jgi:hypothetical protein